MTTLRERLMTSGVFSDSQTSKNGKTLHNKNSPYGWIICIWLWLNQFLLDGGYGYGGCDVRGFDKKQDGSPFSSYYYLQVAEEQPQLWN